MAERKPLVLINGQLQELPVGDTVPGSGGGGLQNNLAATSAPTANNDTSEGYSIGSRWIDVTNDNTYTCVDNTDGAAVWVQENGSGGGGSMTDAEIKTAYENNPNTNALTDALLTKLNNIEAGATGDQTGTEIVATIDAELGQTDWKTPGSGGGSGLPAGGDVNEILKKNSATDGDVSWVLASELLGTPKAAVAPSYNNEGGTGDRSGVILLSTTISFANDFNDLIDGLDNNGPYFATSAAAGDELRFQFAEPKVIEEVRWRQNNATTHATVKWQGSNNGLDWTDLCSEYVLGGATSQTTPMDLDATNSYTFYRMLGVSGNWSSNPYLYEVEFKIGTPAVDGIVGVPAGGTKGQVLVKSSDNDFEAEWVDLIGIVSETANFSISDTHLEGRKHVELTGVSTVTIPENLTNTQPVVFEQVDTTEVSFVAGTNVTINSLSGHLKIAGQYGAATLVPKGNNTFSLIGDLKA